MRHHRGLRGLAREIRDPATAVAGGLLGLALLSIAAMQEVANAGIGSVLSPGDAGCDLIIAPEAVMPANPTALVSSPAEVDTRNNAIVTGILDVRKRREQERIAPKAAAPKLLKVKLSDVTNPIVVEDQPRDNFELLKHTKVKHKKSAVSSATALADSALITGDDDVDIDDFLRSID